jgi:hypothetical protein
MDSSDDSNVVAQGREAGHLDLAGAALSVPWQLWNIRHYLPSTHSLSEPRIPTASDVKPNRSETTKHILRFSPLLQISTSAAARGSHALQRCRNHSSDQEINQPKPLSWRYLLLFGPLSNRQVWTSPFSLLTFREPTWVISPRIASAKSLQSGRASVGSLWHRRGRRTPVASQRPDSYVRSARSLFAERRPSCCQTAAATEYPGR